MQTFITWVLRYKWELTVLSVITATLISFYITWPFSSFQLTFCCFAVLGIVYFVAGGLRSDDSNNFSQLRSGNVSRRRNFRNLFLEILLLSLFLVPLLAVAGIGALHMTIWLAITGSSVVLYLLFPLAANLLAVAVVFLRNPMHSLLALIGVFLNAVVVFISSGAEFLGLVFLIVYVGAVAILFLFVIMLLNVKSLTAGFSLLQHLFQKASFAFAPALTAVLPSRLIPGFFIQAAYSVPLSDVQESTTTETLLYYVNYATSDVMSFATLYTDQVALFLLITCVLLIAMLGAIVLATVTLEEDEPLASVQSHQAPIPLSTVSPYSSWPVGSGCRGHPFCVK